jgi:flagellar hook assembly protein FlgD
MNSNTTVAIYSISGELVQTLNQSSSCQVPDMWGMVYCWNGRNNKGYPVATGIYIYVVEQNNQVTQRGKFLMLNGP